MSPLASWKDEKYVLVCHFDRNLKNGVGYFVSCLQIAIEIQLEWKIGLRWHQKFVAEQKIEDLLH